MTVVKNRSTQHYREYWDHVEAVAAQVRTMRGDKVADKRIVVPDGMLKVANKACVEEIRRLYPEKLIGYITADAMCISDKVVEAAMRWLADNPLVPTLQQCYEIIDDKIDCEGLGPSEYHENGVNFRLNRDQFIAREWQRVAFIAPKEHFDATLGGALNGRTWTQEQADALIDNIRTATHGYVNPLDKQINETIHDIDRHMATDIYRYGKAPEPGVQEAIKDLILPDIESGFFKPEVLNERLLDAFHRGQKSCKHVQPCQPSLRVDKKICKQHRWCYKEGINVAVCDECGISMGSK